jgi:hypothetical protein
MPLISMSHSDLKDLGYVDDAGGQWYKYPDGCPENMRGDNHVHLIGKSSSPGYDPVRNRNPAKILTVEKVELKMRFDRRNIQRVWLIRQESGVFSLPIKVPNYLNDAEREFALSLFNDDVPTKLKPA